MGTLLVRNASVILTLDQAGHRTSGDLVIQGNRLVQVGGQASAPADEVLDASGCIVFPGLINTHHHLYQTYQRNLPGVQDAELFPWLRRLYQVWRSIDPETVYWSAALGIGELLLTGCTTTTDQFYVFPRMTEPHLIDAEIEAAQSLGIRFMPCRGSMSLGESAGGLPPDDVVQDEETILADCQRLIDRYHDPAPYSMLRIALAPCSPFSVSRSLLEKSAEMGRREGVRLHTHLAETRDEERFCLERIGRRPLAYLEEAGWSGSDVWFAHCIYLNEEELQRMADAGSKVAHCPTSNMRLGSGVAPIPRMRELGIDVGLAVDGSASNDSSDMLGEVRNCLLVHKLTHGVSSMSAEQALRLATSGGGAVLGIPEIGSLEFGKAADLALIDLNQLGYAGALSDPLAALVYTGDNHLVKATVVNGRVVVRDGRLVGLAEEQIILQANRLSRHMQEQAARLPSSL
jgi:8-oxoguanine deaminase